MQSFLRELVEGNPGDKSCINDGIVKASFLAKTYPFSYITILATGAKNSLMRAYFSPDCTEYYYVLDLTGNSLNYNTINKFIKAVLTIIKPQL